MVTAAPETTDGAALIDGTLPATLAELLDRGVGYLERGMVPAPPTRAADALHRAGCPGDRPVCAFFAPGRIEVLGKHTDYAGGRSLLAAVERGFTVVAAPRGDDLITIVDAASRQHASFRLDPELRPLAGGWRNYPMTVARRFARNFPAARTGADIAFSSDLPAAAGLSSSSAFVIGVFLALATINRLGESSVYRGSIHGLADLGDYLGAVENGLDYRELAGDRGVGTRGGSQDQTAILCARPGALVQFAFGPVRFEREVPLPPGYTFALACSGVRAAKTGNALGAYNQAAADVALLLNLWREATGRTDDFLGAALESADDAVARLHALTRERPGRLAARLDQFAAETLQLIPAAGTALAAGDLTAFGNLVDRSQRLAEQGLGNQIDETVFLQRAAREAGAAAASAFGAGFGGSVWALVAEREAVDFLERWRQLYRARFSDHASAAEFFLTRATAGARRLS